VSCGFTGPDGTHYMRICDCQKASNGITTCTDKDGMTCTTNQAACYPPTAGSSPSPSTIVLRTPDPVSSPPMASNQVRACESEPPFLPWGGNGSATITVSGGKPCGIGWHDTGATILDSMTVTSPPAHGSLTPQDRHIIIFTPAPGYQGQDSFTLSMQEHNGSRTATMSVKVGVTVSPPSNGIVLRTPDPVSPPLMQTGPKLLPRLLPPSLPTATASTGKPSSTNATTRDSDYDRRKKAEHEKERQRAREREAERRQRINAANNAANAAAAAAAVGAVMGIVGAFSHHGGGGGGGGGGGHPCY
jgi:hypothetical protein